MRKSEGDLAHLGETFNKMTSELRLQQNRLVAASQLIDERRAVHRGGAVGRAGRGDRRRPARARSPCSIPPPNG